MMLYNTVLSIHAWNGKLFFNNVLKNTTFRIICVMAQNIKNRCSHLIVYSSLQLQWARVSCDDSKVGCTVIMRSISCKLDQVCASTRNVAVEESEAFFTVRPPFQKALFVMQSSA